MKIISKKKFRFFVGIDVSKEFFDATVMRGQEIIAHQIILNQETAIKSFLSGLKDIHGFSSSQCVFGMEHTGIYCHFLLETLKKKKASIVHENPHVIRNSLGMIRGKNDKIDSERIAFYLYKCREQLTLWQPQRKVIGQLAVLDTLRNKLGQHVAALQHTEKEIACFLDKKTVMMRKKNSTGTIAAASNDIQEIDKIIKNIVDSDVRLCELMQWMTSVPNVGEKTALQIIIKTNEFKDINDPKKFACFAGIAPFPHASGKSLKLKSRVSRFSDTKMKALLHICAMGSLRSNKELKAYFDRKTKEEGKNGMLVINAIRFKLVLRIFACVNGRRNYQHQL